MLRSMSSTVASSPLVDMQVSGTPLWVESGEVRFRTMKLDISDLLILQAYWVIYHWST